MKLERNIYNNQLETTIHPIEKASKQGTKIKNWKGI